MRCHVLDTMPDNTSTQQMLAISPYFPHHQILLDLVAPYLVFEPTALQSELHMLYCSLLVFQLFSFPEPIFKVGNMRLDILAQSEMSTKLKQINITLFTWLLFNSGERSSFTEV